MIDFRYHLVSLFSVLIALAIGIALGAGPLKEGISESLNSQVKQLRQEKSDLRTQLDASQKTVNMQDSFATDQLGRMVSGKLTSHTVLVVSLPGADTSLVSTVEDTLLAGGAGLRGQVAITDKWVSPDSGVDAARAALGSELATQLGVDGDAVNGGQDLDRVLAEILLTRVPATGQPATTVGPTEAERAAAWSQLRDNGYVQGALPTATAASAIIVSSPLVTAATPTDQTELDSLAALSGALDDGSDGAVVVADLPETPGTTGTSVISAIRGESSIRQILSTVDNVGTPIGRVSMVLALVEQFSGKAGQYGLFAGATSVYPKV